MPILYVDHNGIPAPLSCSYHIADHLTSIRSVVCEVDSTYCPQCFTYQDAYTATKSDCRGRCVRSFCKACPVCFVPLQVAIVESTIGLYQCGYCRYTSFECGVYYDVTKTTATTTTTKDVAEQLDLVYQKKIQDASSVKFYNSLVEAWNEKEQHCRRIQQVQKSCTDPTAAATLLSSSTMKRSGGTVLGTSSSVAHSSNSIQALEQRCKDSTEQKLSSYLTNVLKTTTNETVSYGCISSTNIPPTPPSPTTTISTTTTINSRVQQGVILPTATSSLTTTQNPSSLFPLRIPMLPKLTKRCTLELKKGKPGILIKSKMNPLEGDTTSSRTGHGQWWKKDCSAIHDVPRLDLIKYGSSSSEATRYFSFLLKIHNPLLSPVQLKLTTTTENSYPNVLDNVLLDAYDLRKQSEQIHIISLAKGNSTSSSSWVEMDAAQTIQMLEIYTGNKDSKELWKDAIKGWDATQSIQRFMDRAPVEQQTSTEKEGNENSTFLVLGIDKDNAWVEWTIKVEASSMASAASTNKTSSFKAIPLTMEVLSSGSSMLGTSSTSMQSDVYGGGNENNVLIFNTLVVWEFTDDQ